MVSHALTSRVRELMRPVLPAVAPDTPCAQVVKLMREQDLGAVLVGEEGNGAVGIVTARDIARRAAFRTDAQSPIQAIMSAPVQGVGPDDFLLAALVRMREAGLGQLVVRDATASVVGTLHFADAFGGVANALLDHAAAFGSDATPAGMRAHKAAQAGLVEVLLREAMPAAAIVAALSAINNDLHRRVVEHCVAAMAAAGRGAPPVPFDVIVMGSGGRGESCLGPDQDNGFILADYPDREHPRVDPWFLELAERVTAVLGQVGFDRCPGHVMATNPLWRKSLTQWQRQVDGWVMRMHPGTLRLCDIFFDFDCVHGAGALTRKLREHVRAAARQPLFLRELYREDENYEVALGAFGHLRTDLREGPHRHELDLKLTGTLPLVGAVRIMALRERVDETSTFTRLERLQAAGVVDADERDYLQGILQYIYRLLLRQQVGAIRAGEAIGHHVPVAALARRERDMLVAGFKAIRTFRSRLRAELTAEVY